MNQRVLRLFAVLEALIPQINEKYYAFFAMNEALHWPKSSATTTVRPRECFPVHSTVELSAYKLA